MPTYNNYVPSNVQAQQWLASQNKPPVPKINKPVNNFGFNVGNKPPVPSLGGVNSQAQAWMQAQANKPVLKFNLNTGLGLKNPALIGPYGQIIPGGNLPWLSQRNDPRYNASNYQSPYLVPNDPILDFQNPLKNNQELRWNQGRPQAPTYGRNVGMNIANALSYAGSSALFGANRYLQAQTSNYWSQYLKLNQANYQPDKLKGIFSPITPQGQLKALGYLAGAPFRDIANWWNATPPVPKKGGGPQYPRARAKLNKTKKPAPVYGGGYGYGGRGGGWGGYDGGGGGGGYSGGGNLVTWRIG